MSTYATNLLTLLVIAAGTDYAIFFVGRYQEARGSGEEPPGSGRRASAIRKWGLAACHAGIRGCGTCDDNDPSPSSGGGLPGHHPGHARNETVAAGGGVPDGTGRTGMARVGGPAG